MKCEITSKILEILDNDCTMPLEQISTLVDLPVDRVAEIIEKLTEDKIILKNKSVINWELTDKEFVTAQIELKVTPQRGEGFDKIAEIALSVLQKLPPEVSADIRRSGIYLSGVASSVYALENYYKQKFDISVKVAEDADLAVALGGGIAIGDKSLLKKIELKTK